MNMPASMVIIISTLVTLLTTAGGIMGLTITGEPSVNGTLGGNVSISWKVQNIVHTSFIVYINEIESENELLVINKPYPKTNYTFGEAASGEHDNLRKRSSAYYYYTGTSGEQETGHMVLTITNLTLEDSGRFILRDGNDYIITSVTVLSVQYGPEKCGAGLESEYIVNKEGQVNVTMRFCGKPQPIVKCKFDGQRDTNVHGFEVNQHSYTYTFISTNLKPCEWKQLICTATGHGKPITRAAIVGRKYFSSNLESFIKNIKCLRRYDNNRSEVFWEKELKNGKCNVTYRLSFMNGTYVGHSADYKNSDCNSCTTVARVVSESVRIYTNVYGNLSGSYKLLDNRTSNIVNCSDAPTTTTTTTQKPQEDGEGLSIIIIIAVVGGTLVVILIIVILVVCCMKKKSKRKVTAIPLQEIAADHNNAPQDLEGMYAQVDRSNRNQPTNNVSDLYAQVDKKNKSKNQPASSVSDLYAKVDKKNKSKKEPPSEYAQVDINKPKPQTAANNDYMELEELTEPQGATAMPPQDLSSLYAQVNKNKNLPKEYTIYSELGPGGGRVGPKPIVQPSHYAEARDVAPKPPKGSHKPSSKNKEVNVHHNDGTGDDYEEII